MGRLVFISFTLAITESSMPASQYLRTSASFALRARTPIAWRHVDVEVGEAFVVDWVFVRNLWGVGEKAVVEAERRSAVSAMDRKRGMMVVGVFSVGICNGRFYIYVF